MVTLQINDLGNDATKISGTESNVPGIAPAEGQKIYAYVAYLSTTVHPTLSWEGINFTLVEKYSHTTEGYSLGLWELPRLRTKKVGTVNVTWGSAITARAIIVFGIKGASLKDVSNHSEGDDQSAIMYTGGAVAPTEADTIHIAAYAVNGPDGDSVGTMGLGHTIGQLVGTSLAAPATNLTLIESYEILTSIADCRGSYDNVVSRSYLSMIMALKPAETYTVSKAYYRRDNVNPDMESMHFVMKNEEEIEIFQLRIPRHEYEGMTTEDVDDQILDACAWWTKKLNNNVQDPEYTHGDSEETTLQTFVNRTYTV